MSQRDLPHLLYVTSYTLCVLLCVTSVVQCSDITFTSSPSSIKSLVTDSLALRCGVADGPPTGTSGIIGKRGVIHDVISTDYDISSATSFGHTSSDISTREVKKSDIVFISSIAIVKNNVDVASITEHVVAKVFNTTGGDHVTGNVTASGSERGFLQVTWDYPDSSLSGSYQCVINGYSVDGHFHTLTETVDVADNEVNLNDVVSYMRQLKLDNEQQKLINEQQKLINDQQNQTIEQQKQSIEHQQVINEQQKQSIEQQKQSIEHQQVINDQQKLINGQQNQTIEQQKQMIEQQTTDITQLKGEISTLQNSNADLTTKVDTKVMFSAYLIRSTTVTQGHVLVFDKLRTSIGEGYSTTTGIFTSPVSGYFAFQLHIMGQGDKDADFLLRHNNNYVSWAWADGGFDYNSASDSVVLLLQKGDTVKATARYTSYVLGGLGYGGTSFSGYLINLV